MSGVWTSFIVYTTQVGGDYKVFRADRAEFDRVLAERRIDVSTGWEENPTPKYVTPYYVAFVETADDFDFALGRRREVAA